MKKYTLYYDMILILMAVGSMGLLLFEITHELAPAEIALITKLDITIALIFLADFVGGAIRAEDKGKFWHKRWYEIFAAIPLTNTTVMALRSVRILRIIEIVAVIRIIRLSARLKRLSDFVFDGPTFHLFSLGLVAFTLAFSSSAAFHSYEMGVNPHVKSFFDSFWWSMVTLSTIGYGDIYPVTVEGRIIAIFLMLVGIGVLGTATATIASYLIRQKDNQRIDQLLSMHSGYNNGGDKGLN